MSQVAENRFEVGDLVRVIDADSALHGLEGYIAKTDFGAPPKVYLFESDDKQNRCWLAVDSLRKLRDSWAEPPVDHIADANKMVPPAIPAGWRELFDGETRSKTDLYDFRGKWNPYVDFDPAGSETPKYDKTLHHQHIRKIETANTSEIPNGSASNPPETPDSFIAKRPVVYIAGPMRGIPHFNFPAFDAAKAYLIGQGYDVLSPADFDRVLDDFDPYKPEYETAEGCADFPKTMDFKRVVTRDLTAVTQCDAVASLPGWEKSKGAIAEIAVANWMGKPVIHLLCNAYRHNEVEYAVVTAASTTLEQFVLRLAYAHGEAVKEAICPPPPELNPDCDILDVAASITRGDRQAVYGPPDQDFKKTADMWTGMFQYMLAPGAKFEPRHVAMAMICLKLSREFHQRKRDNWIDIAGYARCGSLCSS